MQRRILGGFIFPPAVHSLSYTTCHSDHPLPQTHWPNDLLAFFWLSPDQLTNSATFFGLYLLLPHPKHLCPCIVVLSTKIFWPQDPRTALAEEMIGSGPHLAQITPTLVHQRKHPTNCLLHGMAHTKSRLKASGYASRN